MLNARSQAAKSGDRTLYQVTVPGLNLPALLWCADEQTLLIALAQESLEKANLPRKGSPFPLDDEIVEVLKQRVARPAILVGRSCLRLEQGDGRSVA